jgi:hypothetical protein
LVGKSFPAKISSPKEKNYNITDNNPAKIEYHHY